MYGKKVITQIKSKNIEQNTPMQNLEGIKIPKFKQIGKLTPVLKKSAGQKHCQTSKTDKHNETVKKENMNFTQRLLDAEK